ncbi:MAG: hypothetical protein A2284_12740 [Deltaproteobacteria bacterium RIFOXYA12_FULL_61_11]|nr:MAG: hypothetical protein A2284_12740 [Deltaproteobacteria bacterium RIFOXYA12_FULL_61_11]
MPSTSVLLVEDETIIAMELEQTLQDLGHLVVARVTTGEAAIEAAARHNPELVLMDIRLAGRLSGVEAAAVILSRRRLPLIFLTAYSDDLSLQSAKNLDACGFLLKPVNHSELHVSIEIALHKFAAEKALLDQQEWLTETLRSLTEGVICTDRKGATTLINARAEALTGRRASEATGRDAAELFPIVRFLPSANSGHPVLQALETGKPVFDNPLSLVPTGPKPLPLKSTAAPVLSAGGDLLGAVWTLEDLSAEYAADRRLQLNRSNDLCQRSTQLLRNLEVLQSELLGPLNEDQVMVLDMLRDDTGTLHLDADRLRLCLQLEEEGELLALPQDVPRVLSGVAASLRPLLGHKQLVPRLALPTGPGPFIEVNEDLLFHLLTSLTEGLIEQATPGTTFDLACTADLEKVTISLEVTTANDTRKLHDQFNSSATLPLPNLQEHELPSGDHFALARHFGTYLDLLPRLETTGPNTLAAIVELPRLSASR